MLLPFGIYLSALPFLTDGCRVVGGGRATIFGAAADRPTREIPSSRPFGALPIVPANPTGMKTPWPHPHGYSSQSMAVTRALPTKCMAMAGSSERVVSNSQVAIRLWRKNFGMPIGW